MSALVGEQMHLVQLDGSGTHVIFELAVPSAYGRLRTPVLGPDGNLYVTTSNGTDDKILRVTPS